MFVSLKGTRFPEMKIGSANSTECSTVQSNWDEHGSTKLHWPLWNSTLRCVCVYIGSQHLCLHKFKRFKDIHQLFVDDFLISSEDNNDLIKIKH